MSFEQGFVAARDDACGMAGEIGKLDNEARDPSSGPARLVRPDGAPRSRSRALVSGSTTGDHNSDRVASVQGHTRERLTLSDPGSG